MCLIACESLVSSVSSLPPLASVGIANKTDSLSMDLLPVVSSEACLRGVVAMRELALFSPRHPASQKRAARAPLTGRKQSLLLPFPRRPPPHPYVLVTAFSS